MIVSYLQESFDTAMQQAKVYKKSQRKRQKLFDVFAGRKDKGPDAAADDDNAMESFYDLKELMERQVRNAKKTDSPQFMFRGKKKRLGDSPMPRGQKLGTLKTSIIEARELVQMSRFAQFPDAYCIACVGDQYFKTEVIKASGNPSWNQLFEFEVYVRPTCCSIHLRDLILRPL